jgi:hypothetical protein
VEVQARGGDDTEAIDRLELGWSPRLERDRRTGARRSHKRVEPADSDVANRSLLLKSYKTRLRPSSTERQ